LPKPARGFLLLALTLADGAGAQGDPARELFLSGCLAAERAELRGSATWPWIEELCLRYATQRATEFQAADRAGRLRLLADECRAWHATNAWRLPDRLRLDARAQAGYVEASCATEAEERLTGLERGDPR